MSTTFQGDVFVAGQFFAQYMSIPANAIGNSQVVAGAGIEATKLEQQVAKSVNFSNHATNVAVARLPLHRVYGVNGSIVSFGVTATVPAGAGGTATVDLKKNGVTVLSGTFQLNDTHAAYQLVTPAGFTSTALLQGDHLDAEITAVAGTVPKGVTAWLVVREKPQ